MFSKEKLTAMETPLLLKLMDQCEQSERYDDMVKCAMNLLERSEKEPEKINAKEQRNLISVACKNVVGQMRSCSRNIEEVATEDQTPFKESKEACELYQKYRRNKCILKCQQILTALASTVASGLEFSEEKIKGMEIEAEVAETQVFWLKMMGDYCRYIAEIDKDYKMELKGLENIKGEKSTADWADNFYKAASAIADRGLGPESANRLGLALNYSVFYYETLGKQKEACALAKSAFDEAVKQMDKLSESEYKDSALILQLLRDNLTLWNAGLEKDDEAEQ